jgi:hypothetical protein
MPDHLVRDVILVSMLVVPLLGFLRELRDRVAWIREAENGKDAVRRLLRTTIVMLLYLITLCLYLSLTWWILSQPLEEMR